MQMHKVQFDFILLLIDDNLELNLEFYQYSSFTKRPQPLHTITFELFTSFHYCQKGLG